MAALGADLDLPSDVPHKASQFTSDGDADLVLRQTTADAQAFVALGEPQLGHARRCHGPIWVGPVAALRGYESVEL